MDRLPRDSQSPPADLFRAEIDLEKRGRPSSKTENTPTLYYKIRDRDITKPTKWCQVHAMCCVSFPRVSGASCHFLNFNPQQGKKSALLPVVHVVFSMLQKIQFAQEVSF